MNDYNQRNVDFKTIHATSKTHFDIFYEVLHAQPPSSLLDIGGGYGSLLFEYLNRFPNLNFDYNILEASSFQIEKGKKILAEHRQIQKEKLRIAFLHAEFLTADLPAQKFSHIVLKMVLHEFAKNLQNSVLNKTFELLQDNGIVLVWIPLLKDHDFAFFNAVIKEKDFQAGYLNLSAQRHFCHQKEFIEMAKSAGFSKINLIFNFEYILDTQLRLSSEFNNNEDAYSKWLTHINYLYNNLSSSQQNQIHLLSMPSRIFIQFFRGLYLLKK